MKKILIGILAFITLAVPSRGQQIGARYTEMNANVPFWIAFSNGQTNGGWSSGTVLTLTGGCSPSIVSSYYKGANPPFNSDTIMALVNPGTCPGTVTVTEPLNRTHVGLTIRSSPKTYYIRSDGGTRWDVNNTRGTCDGWHDAPDPGSGALPRHCAWNDIRLLWVTVFTYDSTFESYFNFFAIAGGDTVIIRGAHSIATSLRIGQRGPNSGDYFFLAGNPSAAGMPSPPMGTASFPTKVYGENYASCTGPSAKTFINPGYGVGAGVTFARTSNVIMACFDEMDHSSCGNSGQSTGCNRGFPYTDFMGVGVAWANTATKVTLQDFYEHGAASLGMQGPTGDGVVLNRVSFEGNAGGGWNEDNGASDQTNVFLGNTLVENYDIGWSGCAEQYPAVGTYGDCTDDNSGGYGDGFGTATLANLTAGHVHWDNGSIHHSTQDGHDALHLHGAGSSMTITRALDYANMGNQIKIGGTSGLVVNSISIGNCNSMRYQQPNTVAPEVSITAWSTDNTNAYFTTAPQKLVAGQVLAFDLFISGGSIFNGVTNNSISATGLTSTTFQVRYPGVGVHSGTETTAEGSTWNGKLTDFCRASDVSNVIITDSNSASAYYFDTFYCANHTCIEADGNMTPKDRTQVFDLQNNVMLGFLTNNANGYLNGGGTGDYSNPIAPSFSANPFTNPGGAFSYNDSFHWKSTWSCPNKGLGETNALCVDPLLTNETWTNTGIPGGSSTSFVPQGGSPVLAAGTAVANLTACQGFCTIDYFGNPRNLTHPSMGAIEGNSTTIPTAPKPTASRE